MFKMHCLFEFPLNSKQNLAGEWLRIIRSRPVALREEGNSLHGSDFSGLTKSPDLNFPDFSGTFPIFPVFLNVLFY